MENIQITPELYFQRYACPCASVLLTLKRIDKATFDKVNELTLKDQAMTREDLEKIFPEAFRRIKKLALNMDKDYWDVEVLKQYFLRGEHNKEIDSGDGFYAAAPPSLKELCKVHKAEVVLIKENVLKVKIGDKHRVVVNKFIPEIKLGDNVTVHYGFVVEKV